MHQSTSSLHLRPSPCPPHVGEQKKTRPPEAGVGAWLASLPQRKLRCPGPLWEGLGAIPRIHTQRPQLYSPLVTVPGISPSDNQQVLLEQEEGHIPQGDPTSRVIWEVSCGTRGWQ